MSFINRKHSRMIDSENYSLNHTHWFIGIVLCAFVLLLGCNRLSDQEEQFFSQASENAKLANEGLRRSNRYMNAWLEKADTETGLIPRNLGDSRDIWNAKDAAADNYPFMVLTASITNNELYKGRLTDMLRTEERLTSRLGALPDTWSFKKDDFASGRPDTADIIFGASEYIKDGLLPLTEWLGESVWSDRMLHMMDDIWKYASVSTEYGKIPSENVEINGEMLQALPRLYYMKDEDKYLDWAVRLGNYYLLGDGYKSLYQKDIRLRDHGCEIISGLCELYCCVSFSRSDLKEKYKAPLYRLLDRILEVGRNRHGLFYNVVNLNSEEIINEGIADTWGYTLNGYFTVYLLDETQKYRQPVINAFNNLHHYDAYDWERGSADGYADAIESALNLYNREPMGPVGKWMDDQTQIMWSMQDSSHRENALKWKDSGIIEGWHGDGNFARTTIMYCLWKTQGLTAKPWDESLQFGAVSDTNTLYISIRSGEAWNGELIFDYKRHKENMGLPLDYPRINQFPEWFTVDRDKKYQVTRVNENSTKTYEGEDLLDGLDLNLKGGDWYYLKIKRVAN
ncbi:MAG: hypothetical protein KGY69_11770 [Bacteroidales bacterium]|nr:hypothetical protein [Bacteroidales bacterium]